jgi:uncharacterized protein (DUF1330 family)
MRWIWPLRSVRPEVIAARREPQHGRCRRPLPAAERAKTLEDHLPAYAVAHMRQVTVGPEIVEYLQRIDATLEPFGGRFVVHGGAVEVIEGSWPGNLIAIEFPDREHARAWYKSAAYQEILPLRTDNSDSDVILVDGVHEGHHATDVLSK